MMRVVFMGTPGLAAGVLEKLAASHDVLRVYTRPDAVRGRGKKLVASPVKETALNLGLEVCTPENMTRDDVVESLQELAPDAICVAAYGAILPRSILDIPKYGCLNVHTSLLPRWRGAAPMERAILACDEEAGVCIMKMEEGLDTGPYCKRATVELDDMYLDELESRLSHAGAELLVEALAELESGTAVWVEQDAGAASYAPKVGKAELDLDPADGVRTTCAKIRASSDAHPSHAVIAGRQATVVGARIADDEDARAFCLGMEPGDARFVAKRFFLAASDGIIELEKLKPQGKKEMDARAFAAGIQGIKNQKAHWGRP